MIFDEKFACVFSKHMKKMTKCLYYFVKKKQTNFGSNDFLHKNFIELHSFQINLTGLDFFFIVNKIVRMSINLNVNKFHAI